MTRTEKQAKRGEIHLAFCSFSNWVDREYGSREASLCVRDAGCSSIVSGSPTGPGFEPEATYKQKPQRGREGKRKPANASGRGEYRRSRVINAPELFI